MIAFSWIVLVVFWVTVVLAALIADKVPIAVAIAITAVMCMYAWFIFLRWLFGLRRLIRAHLLMPTELATFLDKPLTRSMATDLRIALEEIRPKNKEAQVSRVGVAFSYASSIERLRVGNIARASLKWTTVERESMQHIQVPTNAVYFLNISDGPCVIHIQESVESEEDFGRTWQQENLQRLEIYSRSLTHASAVVRELLALASRHSIYRGKLLSLDAQSVRMFERPNVTEDRLVLPSELLALIKRSVISRMEYHEILHAAGHESKTGILLHGAPGTGKTLVSKFLVSQCPNHTAIVPIAMDADTIRKAFSMAAYLQPSIVVIDDVDLLAERRETNSNLNGLQELMNELDGMLPSTQAIVLMTTNRPDVLEPALASRPGRISQAVFFPLPDPAMRERLIKLFARKLNLTGVDLARWVQRTEGASPAFIEELVKKAIIFAAIREASTTSLPGSLSDADFDAAIHELVVLGGALTTNILGFPSSGLPASGLPPRATD